MLSNPIIVLGPPGTGKTTHLLEVVDQQLSRGVEPDRIGYLSFTRRAAEEAVTRATAKFNLTAQQLPFFRTLHSLCYRQLGMSRGDVLDGVRLQRDFADYAGVKVTARWNEDGTMSGFEFGDRILFMENLARMRDIPLVQQYRADNDQLPWLEVDRVADCLRQFKTSYGVMDYTDMLSEFLRSGIQIPLDVLCVDEAQDLSRLQWRVVEQLAQHCPLTVIAGDDDQAIYRWAGADVETLIAMAGDIKVLGQSWRVPQELQNIALELIAKVQHRRPKEWAARKGGLGEMARVGQFRDVDCGTGDILVLARNNYLLKEQIVPVLRREGIIYEMYGHPSVRPVILDAITNWEKLRAGGEVAVEAARDIYSYMTVDICVKRGFKTLKKFQDGEQVSITTLQERGGLLTTAIWHEAMSRLPRDEMLYILAARRRGEKLRARPRVRVSTVHGSKGGEADHVVLLLEMARRTHADLVKTPEDEMRVWYVGVTRARERLSLVRPSTKQGCPWL